MLPALPYMGEALGISHENERQLVVGAYMLGFGLAQLVFEPASRPLRPPRPLLFGLSIYVVCAFAATFAPISPVLLALRLTQGLGAAATRVVATAVVRDRFAGRDMAEVMSLIFMVFMAMPIIAPASAVLLLTGPWQSIFVFMAGLATLISLWAFFRLPETLHPRIRRELTFKSVTGGFGIVFTNRLALFWPCRHVPVRRHVRLRVLEPEIFVDIFGLGALFPVAFAAMAGMMAVSSFLNSRIVSASACAS